MRDVTPHAAGLSLDIRTPLDAFSLEIAVDIAAGETLALLGPNGAGKTTTLEIVAGLRVPAKGRIHLDGRVLLDTDHGIDLAPEARRVGLLTQSDSLFPHRPVFDNVAYGPRARRLARGEIDRTVLEWLARFDLVSLRARRVGSLSGGERQRVALARALASGARLLLLDEPFSSLDAATRAGIRAELGGFLGDAGIPALLVTHDPVDAFHLARRIAVIEQGAIVQCGAPEELLTRPRSSFVAGLVDLNFHRAELAPGTGLREARAGAVTFHVVSDAPPGPVHLAFAPSAVALSREPPSGSFQNAFRVSVRETRSLPDRVRVVLDAGVPIAADITREAALQLRLAPGDTQWAMVKAMAIHVYR